MDDSPRTDDYVVKLRVRGEIWRRVQELARQDRRTAPEQAAIILERSVARHKQVETAA
jgi:hypothetical protein